MLIFAVEEHHQKARQDAIAKIEPGAALWIEAVQPLWDRPIAIELRSPRGPKGASLGYAPGSVAAQLATLLGGASPVTATALRVEQRHGLRQLVVGVTLGESVDLVSPETAQSVEQAPSSAPKEPVLIPTVYPVGIVGEASYQAAIRRARVGQPVRLVHEPSNPHDRQAISVQSALGECIGYLPRDSWLHRVLLDEGKQLAGRIKSIEGSPRGVVLDVVVGTAADLEKAAASTPMDATGEDAEQAEDAKGASFSLSSPIVIIGVLLALALLYQCAAG